MNKYADAGPPAPATLRRRLVRTAAEALLPPSLMVMRGVSGRREVALTFDDGPEELLSDYLDVLDRAGARATFFLLGECCSRRRNDLLEIVRRGHEVASHGYTHKKFTRMSRAELDDELERTAELLPIQRVPRALVRPPQGATSLRSMARCAMLGYTTVLWSLDSDDCRTRDPAVVIDKVSPKNVAPGEIVLLHEGQRWTLDALAPMIDALKEAGYSLVTVGDLLRP
jgi:peptidoglycan/xylan/chitin deacetylase (PgdA/CDA1 family)